MTAVPASLEAVPPIWDLLATVARPPVSSVTPKGFVPKRLRPAKPKRVEAGLPELPGPSLPENDVRGRYGRAEDVRDDGVGQHFRRSLRGGSCRMGDVDDLRLEIGGLAIANERYESEDWVHAAALRRFVLVRRRLRS